MWLDNGHDIIKFQTFMILETGLSYCIIHIVFTSSHWLQPVTVSRISNPVLRADFWPCVLFKACTLPNVSQPLSSASYWCVNKMPCIFIWLHEGYNYHVCTNVWWFLVACTYPFVALSFCFTVWGLDKSWFRLWLFFYLTIDYFLIIFNKNTTLRSSCLWVTKKSFRSFEYPTISHYSSCRPFLFLSPQWNCLSKNSFLNFT